MSVIFPKWMNILPTAGAIGGLAVACGVIGGFWYFATPKFWRVGYMPTQPGGGFNHQIHAGKLGIDCRYCHTHIEESPEANVPNVATCYGCHQAGSLLLYDTSESHKNKTEFIREAYSKDASVEWRRIHKLPDYVRNFPHNVHLHAGVSCYSCHGRIDTMPVVYEHEPLSMSWCLSCHRSDDKALVPTDKVTNLAWVETQLKDRANGEAAALKEGKLLVDTLKAAPPQNCGACHY